MNYFAHARVAARLGGSDALLLGAMLPDFARMIGVRLAPQDHPELADGTRLHHRTDAAFHAAPAFRHLERAGVASLCEAGLRRGPSRGAAHVALELLLDAALAGGRDDARYLAALERAPALAPDIAWHGHEGPSRWRRLHARLRAAGAPERRPTPQRIADRVTRALAPRPRLRLSGDEPRRLAGWISGAAPVVEARAPELLAQTLAGLARSPGPALTLAD